MKVHQITFRIILFAGLLSVVACKEQKVESKTRIDQFWEKGNSPEEIGALITEELFTRPKYMMYETNFLTAIHYAEVCAAYGAAKLAVSVGNSEVMDRLVDRYGILVDDSIALQTHHVDGNVYGILPFKLFEYNGDTSFLDQGLYLANAQWDLPLDNGLTNQTRYWIDDVYMIGSLQAQAYRSTGNVKYLDRAALEIYAYLDSLQENNGLFFHGPEAPFYWGRGNGWVAAGVAEIIAVLPTGHKLYTPIKEGYLKMMSALLNYQAESGMWRQLIDDPQAWEESSSTAMFGYAMSEGLNKGLLEGEAYHNAVKKAWNALCNRVDKSGKVTDVCVGTGQSLDRNYYLDRPRATGDFHGQAPVLWFGNSLLNRQN